MDYEEIILGHYRKVAKNYGTKAESTMEDVYIRQVEIDFILEEVRRYLEEMKMENSELQLLDVGCGNGHMLSVLYSHFSGANLAGREFTPELLHLAQSRGLEGIDFAWGDCRQEDFYPHSVDIVMSERVVINILNRSDQVKVLQNITQILKKRGRYLMIESFKAPLERLNKAAREMKLEEYKESYQNLYLDEDLIEVLEKGGLKEIASVRPSNYLSTHFFLTRIFHRLLRPPGGKVKNSEFVHFFREALPPGVGHYSPILLRVFEKI